MVDTKQDYDAYTYVNKQWQQIGSNTGAINLEEYMKKSDSFSRTVLYSYLCGYNPITMFPDLITNSNNYYEYLDSDKDILAYIIDLISNQLAYTNYNLSNFKTQTTTNLSDKSDKTDTYLKSDISNYINNLNLSTNFPNTDVTSLPTDKTLWAWLFNAILTELRNKATYDDLEDLIGVSERRYYANSKDALPSTGDSSVLYFVLIDSEDDVNQYEEYVWVNNRYELLGTSNSSMDLSNFYNKDDIDSMIGDLQDYLNS